MLLKGFTMKKVIVSLCLLTFCRLFAMNTEPYVGNSTSNKNEKSQLRTLIKQGKIDEATKLIDNNLALLLDTKGDIDYQLLFLVEMKSMAAVKDKKMTAKIRLFQHHLEYVLTYNRYFSETYNRAQFENKMQAISNKKLGVFYNETANDIVHKADIKAKKKRNWLIPAGLGALACLGYILYRKSAKEDLAT